MQPCIDTTVSPDHTIMLRRIAHTSGSTNRIVSPTTLDGCCSTGPASMVLRSISRHASSSTSSRRPPFPTTAPCTNCSQRLSHSNPPIAQTIAAHQQMRQSSSSTSATTDTATDTNGSFHTPSSTTSLLTDLPGISPRALVRYLDTYVVGQTRAKKVLAVGVWNHYLRVASNQRMRDEAAAREQEQAADATSLSPSDVPQDNAETPASPTSKLARVSDADKAAWQSHQKIKDERSAEAEPRRLRRSSTQHHVWTQ